MKVFVFLNNIVHWYIRKENFSKSTNALQTEIHSFTQAQNKRIFTWDFQEKTNKRTSIDVNRPEMLQTSPLKAHFDNALQEGENVNFFTLSRPRQNYSAKCLASFRLGLGLQTFFNFMFIKTSLSLFTLWSPQRPPNCIWPWDDCETRTPDMAMTLMFSNISSWNQIEQLFLPAPPPPSLSPLRNLGYAGRSWTVWNTR